MNDLQNIWKEIKIDLSNSLTAMSFLLFIDNLQPVCIKDNDLVLCAPSKNTQETVEEHYIEKIMYAVHNIGLNFNNIVVIIEEDKSYFKDYIMSEEKNEVVKPKIEVQQEKKSDQFIRRYTFNNFVVGECNRFAFMSADSVAKNPGINDSQINLNPLFIYGGVGLGKTHLLHAIGNYLVENNPANYKVVYVPAETLTNEYFKSLNKYSSDKDAYRKFREKYTKADVLMVDDVQFLQKKGGLQEVFFHIFNDLYNAGKQIILSSDRPPKDINDIEDRLRSRFSWGMSADMDLPSFDTRIAIILKKLELVSCKLSDEIIYYIAETSNSNIRELEGALNKVVMYAELMNKKPSLDLAKEALKVNSIETNTVTLDGNKIIDAVCQFYNVQPNEIISKKKTKVIAEARMVAIYLIREILALPLVTIGQLFGGKDHTTISYSVEKIRSGIAENKKTATIIKDIKCILNVDK